MRKRREDEKSTQSKEPKTTSLQKEVRPAVGTGPSQAGGCISEEQQGLPVNLWVGTLFLEAPLPSVCVSLGGKPQLGSYLYSGI